MKYAQKIIFAKFQTHANVIPSTTLLIMINMKRYPDVETNEHGEGVMRWGVIPMQFPFINYGMELYKRQYTDKHVTLSKCMCMRASGASELRKFWHFHTLKLLFLSIFCRYIENKPGLNFIWGGKRPPKPPHQYASGSSQPRSSSGSCSRNTYSKTRCLHWHSSNTHTHKFIFAIGSKAL